MSFNKVLYLIVFLSFLSCEETIVREIHYEEEKKISNTLGTNLGGYMGTGKVCNSVENNFYIDSIIISYDTTWSALKFEQALKLQ